MKKSKHVVTNFDCLLDLNFNCGKLSFKKTQPGYHRVSFANGSLSNF